MAPLELVVQDGQRVLQELVRAAIQDNLRLLGLIHELDEVAVDLRRATASRRRCPKVQVEKWKETTLSHGP